MSRLAERLFFLATLVLLGALPAGAIEVRVTAPALERTLVRQLFNQPGPDGQLTRHYLRGDAHTGCAVYVDDPHITFRRVDDASTPAISTPEPETPDAQVPAAAPDSNDRIVVTVHTHARIGFGRNCFGITISTEAQVSFIPEAEGESIGFRDARIEHLSANKELDLLLEPFLKKKLPTEMKVNAATLIGKLLVRAPDSTGYTLTLGSLDLKTMRIEGDVLVVNLDCNIRVE